MLRSALLARAASQLQLLREQNRKMVKLLKRVGREGGLVAQLDAARQENKTLLCKYTAVQVRVKIMSWYIDLFLLCLLGYLHDKA